MKVAYIGMVAITDSEFPLIREFYKKGLDIICYYPIRGHVFRSGLIDIGDVKKKDDIISSKEYDAFKKYEAYLNLDKIFIINNYHCRLRNWQSYFIWLKLIKHIYKQKVDILHFVWPFTGFSKILYWMGLPKVMTVHDPFPHSSQDNKKNEIDRVEAFTHSKKYMLLSETQKLDFSLKYKIKLEDIYVTKFGLFDWLDYLKERIVISKTDRRRYILFWGQIQAHKGIDTLLEAMLIVHRTIPDLRCIIAGKGDFWFNISKYQQLDYIEFRNYYITTEELINLLYECEFAVVPYKDATQSGVVQTAFSASIPLIVTNVGALPEMVIDGQNGIVIPPNDSCSLATAIIKMASSPQLLSKFRNNIETKWKPQMNWGHIADKYLKMYSSIMK